MKHIFVVHSNITYLAALGVIAHNDIPKGDVLLISQNYVRSTPLEVHRVQLFSKNIFRLACVFNFALRADRLIDRFASGRQFALYVPAVTKLARIALTHPLCGSLNFIEEGIGSYMRQYVLENHTYEDRKGSVRASLSWAYVKQTFTSTINLWRGETQHLHSIPMNYTSYVGAGQIDFYGFHSAVFPLSATRKVISFQDIAQRFPFSSDHSSLDGACILVGEGLFSLTESYSVDQYCELLEFHVIPWLKSQQVERVHLRYHYNESERSRTETLRLLREAGLEVEIIDPSVIMEVALLKTSGARLVGCTSSLLFYAALMGCKSYSYSNFLSSDLLSLDAYWQVVEKIDYK